MKIKMAILALIVALGVSVISHGQERQIDQPPSLEVGKISDIGKEYGAGLDFKGRLLWVPILGKGITKQRAVCLYVYYPPDGSAAYVVSGSPLKMAEMLRTEYPDGIDAKFANGILRFFLLGCCGENDSMIVTRGAIEMLNERIPDIPRQKLAELIKALFEPPVVDIHGNEWNMRAMIIGVNNTIHAVNYKGTLKPFTIAKFQTGLIFDPPHAFRQNFAGCFYRGQFKTGRGKQKKVGQGTGC